MATVQAYINWGRWVVDCPICHNGILVDTFPPSVSCRLCGTLLDVYYPPNRRAIEKVLSHRPPRKVGAQMLPINRNWTSGESLGDLKHENREHGLPDTEEAD